MLPKLRRAARRASSGDSPAAMRVVLGELEMRGAFVIELADRDNTCRNKSE